MVFAFMGIVGVALREILGNEFVRDKHSLLPYGKMQKQVIDFFF